MINPAALVDRFRYAFNNHWGYIWGKAGVLWTQKMQNASTRESTVKYGSKWVGHYVADCSGLFSWAFKQLGGYMYHGSNTMWNRYCTAKGRLSGGRKEGGGTLLPGTAVFTGSDDNKPHVGLYVGNGEVIEASGTIAGVIKTLVTNKKWKYWGELKGVNYSTSPTTGTNTETTTEIPATVRKGDRGEVVRKLQELLISKGYSLPKYGTDGSFGKETLSAVKAYQKDHGLSVDGVVGRNTWTSILTK